MRMPPLVVLAVAGVGLYAGYRLFSKLIEQAQSLSPVDIDRQRREAATRMHPSRDLGQLEWDEAAGVYRPRSKPG
jgi:hypothetical protein